MRRRSEKPHSKNISKTTDQRRIQNAIGKKVHQRPDVC